MTIDVIHTGPLGVNTYIVPLGGSAVFIVDPASCAFSGDEFAVTRFLEEKRLVPKAVVLTHGHFDHVAGLPHLVQCYPQLQIAIHKADAPFIGVQSEVLQSESLSTMGFEEFIPSVSNLPEQTCFLEDGRTLCDCLKKCDSAAWRADLSNDNLGKASFSNAGLSGVSFSSAGLSGVSFSSASLGGASFSGAELSDANLGGARASEAAVLQTLAEWQVIHTPGHSPGSVCLYNEKERTLLSGDTLFYHSYGRTDLPGGNEMLIQKSVRRLQKEIPANTLVYPGHDAYGFVMAQN